GKVDVLHAHVAELLKNKAFADSRKALEQADELAKAAAITAGGKTWIDALRGPSFAKDPDSPPRETGQALSLFEGLLNQPNPQHLAELAQAMVKLAQDNKQYQKRMLATKDRALGKLLPLERTPVQTGYEALAKGEQGEADTAFVTLLQTAQQQ